MVAVLSLLISACQPPGIGPTTATPATHTVTYNGNGNTSGSVPVDSTKYTEGQTATVDGNTGGLFKSGDSFGEWNTAADRSGTSYAAGAPLTIGTANVTLYAQWTIGSAQWAKTVSGGSNASQFNKAAVDSSGNVYTAGYQYGSGTFTYGSGVSATDTYGSGDNATLVKYNSGGVAQWAATVSGGSNASQFEAVAVDSSGNVYAVGYQYGTGTFTYGNGASATGPSTYNNAVLVKYNSSGVAQWARTVSAETPIAGAGASSKFLGVAVDSSGNVYVAGYQASGTYTYGTITVTSNANGNDAAVLVKYNSAGVAQWGTAANGPPNAQLVFSSTFYTVTVDSSGNIYAAGFQFELSSGGGDTFTYGNGVSATGAVLGAEDAVLVKYNSAGAAQWAQTVSAAQGVSSSSGIVGGDFGSVAVDSSGNVYAAGNQGGTGIYTYGPGVSATGTFSGGGNALLVKYNAAGVAQWAQTVSAGSSNSGFSGVAVDSSGNVYAASVQYGSGTFTYGNQSVAGPYSGGSGYSYNAALVKYNAAGVAQWAQTVNAGSNNSYFTGAAVDSASGNIYATGMQQGSGTFTYCTGVAATATYSAGTNSVLVKYGP